MKRVVRVAQLLNRQDLIDTCPDMARYFRLSRLLRELSNRIKFPMCRVF